MEKEIAEKERENGKERMGKEVKGRMGKKGKRDWGRRKLKIGKKGKGVWGRSKRRKGLLERTGGCRYTCTVVSQTFF
jgi:hypothetical protein